VGGAGRRSALSVSSVDLVYRVEKTKTCKMRDELKGYKMNAKTIERIINFLIILVLLAAAYVAADAAGLL